MRLVACEVVTSKSVKATSPSVSLNDKTRPSQNSIIVLLEQAWFFCRGPGPFLQTRALIPSQDVLYMSPTRPQGCGNIRI